jgi:membrane-associated protein
VAVTRRRAEITCLAGLSFCGIYSLATLPFAPSLLGKHPVVLELLRGSIPAMVAGGAFARVGEASLVLALLAPLPTLMMADPFLYWAGRIWGPSVAEMLAGGGRSERSRRWQQRAAHWSEHYGSWAVLFSYFIPIPSALVFAGAGWTGMRIRRFIALDIAGTSLWILTNVLLGYIIGQSAVDVAKAIGRYSLWVTIVIVVIVFAVSFRRSARQPGGG